MTLRLMLVTENTNIGGHNRYALNLARQLHPRQATAELIAVRCKADRWLFGQAHLSSLSLHTLSTRLRDLPLAAARFVRLAREFRPDIVHSQAYLSNLVARIGSRFLRPRPALVSTQHGPYASSRPLWQLLYALDVRTAWMADAIIGVCEDSRRWILRKSGVNPARVHVVLNGVDEVPALPFIDRPRPVVGFVGRLAIEKGPDVLIEALDQLAASVDLLIVGDGPLFGKLQARLARRRWPGDVVLVGPQHDLDLWYQRMDLVVIPSRAVGDGVPLVLLEAMMRGRPVVASAAGGIPEVVKDRVTGWLVPPGSAQALASRLGEVLADRDRLRAIGESAFPIAHSRFTLRRMAAETYDVYRSVLR